MEVFTEGPPLNIQITMKLVNNFHGDLKGDDNNTYQNGGDDSDVIDDVTDAINGTKMSLKPS